MKREERNLSRAEGRTESGRKGCAAPRIFAAVLLTLLSAATVCFIFSNSFRDGAASSAQSQAVTEGVQEVIGGIAPSSPAANASGKDFARLHALVRKCAHFLEFALLGALLLWTCRAYTPQRKFWAIPPCLVLLVATADELLQLLSPGRGTSLKDILIDTAGGVTGMAAAIACLGLCSLILAGRRASVRKVRSGFAGREDEGPDGE